MKLCPLVMAVALVSTPAILASPAGTKGDTEKSLELSAKLQGPDGMDGEVHYLEEGLRIRIKVSIRGLRASDAKVVLDGRPFPLVMDPLRGTGYLYLDSLRTRVVRLEPGDRVSVTANGLTMMRGTLEKVP